MKQTDEDSIFRCLCGAASKLLRQLINKGYLKRNFTKGRPSRDASVYSKTDGNSTCKGDKVIENNA